MAYAFNDDKSRADVIPKSHQFGIGTKVTLSKTLSNSNKTVTYNYTMPSDGYINVVDTSGGFSGTFDSLALSGIPFADFVEQYHIETSGGAAVMRRYISKSLIHVKKGMTVTGAVTFNNDTNAQNFNLYYYPLT